MKKIRNLFFYFAFILLITLGVYSPSFKAPFQLDDIKIIEKNPLIRTFNHLDTIWANDPSRFLTHLSFTMNYQIGQLDPLGYHLVNFLLHICIGIVVFFFLREIFRICQTKEEEEATPAGRLAFWATLIFAIHPIQTSAVTYTVQRATLLASLSYLLSCLGYLYFRKTKKVRFYILSLGTALLGAFCKPIIITLPLTLIALELILLRNEEFYDFKSFKHFSYKMSLKNEGLRVLPYFFLWILLPILLTRVAHTFSLFELTRQTDAISRQTYLFTQFNVYIKYIRLLFLPLNQNLDYSYPLAHTLGEFPTIVSFLLVLILWGIAWKSLSKNKLLSFALFFFFITLSLESSIFPLSDVIFEHRLYLPLLALAMLVPQFSWVIKRKKVFYAGLILFLVFLGTLTVKRNILWNNHLLFLEDVAQKSYDKPRPQVNLGIAYMNNKYYEQAKEQFYYALEIDGNYMPAHLALGALYFQEGELDGALYFFQKASELDPFNDEAYNNAGVAYALQGKFLQALESFNRAIDRNEWNVEALNNRARLYELNGNFQPAIEDYTAAIKIDSSDAWMYMNRARVLERNKQFKVAFEDVSQAQKLGLTVESEYILHLKKHAGL